MGRIAMKLSNAARWLAVAAAAVASAWNIGTARTILDTATIIPSVHKIVSLLMTTPTRHSNCILQNESQTRTISVLFHTICHDDLRRLTQK